MEFDLRTLSSANRYRLMASIIIPRPIAWVTSQDSAGQLNAAPFSFFNMMGDDPPTVVLGVMLRAGGRLKDTAINIRTTGEFVVNMVGEDDVAAMNLTSAEAPPCVDETVLASLALEASVAVGPPRISSAPASFECRLLKVVDVSASQSLLIGEVLYGHVQDRFVTDAAKLRIDAVAMRLIGRVHGAGWYSRQTDLFQLKRPAWPIEAADHEGRAGAGPACDF